MKLQRIFTACALGLLLCLLAGCAFLDDLKLFRAGAEGSDTVLEQDLDADDSAAAPTETGTAAPGPETAEKSTTPAPAEPAAAARRVTLYFAGADGKLVPEEREIPAQEGLARATVNELIAGPQTAGLSPTLPASALVEGMTVRDGLCTVDFSSELTERLPADAASQKLAVYSIVNTLSQFDTVEQVRILVDGEPLSGSVDGIDLSAALAPAGL